MDKEKLFESFSKKLDNLIETNEIFKYYFQKISIIFGP